MLIKYALSQTSIVETIIYTAVFWFILMWTNDAHLLNGTSLQQFFVCLISSFLFAGLTSPASVIIGGAIALIIKTVLKFWFAYEIKHLNRF